MQSLLHASAAGTHMVHSRLHWRGHLASNMTKQWMFVISFKVIKSSCVSVGKPLLQGSECSLSSAIASSFSQVGIEQAWCMQNQLHHFLFLNRWTLTMCNPWYFSCMLVVVCFSYRHPSSRGRLWDWDSSQDASLMVLLIQVGSVHIDHSITICLCLPDSGGRGSCCSLLYQNQPISSYHSMSFGFFHELGAWIPWQRSHHRNAGTVWPSNDSSKAAPGISLSVSCTSDNCAPITCGSAALCVILCIKVYSAAILQACELG